MTVIHFAPTSKYKMRALSRPSLEPLSGSMPVIPRPSRTSADVDRRPSEQNVFRNIDRALASRYFKMAVAQRHHRQAIATGVEMSMIPRMQAYSPPTSTHSTALFELPGLKSSDISVNITKAGKLIVSGRRCAPDDLANTQSRGELYPIQEFKYGRFERTIEIPAGLETRHVTASLDEGILKLSWPRVVPVDSRSELGSPAITSIQAIDC